MADPTDILLKIATEGDTSGAEAVEESLFKVQDATETARQNADVDKVLAKQAAESAEETAAAIDDTARAAEALVAANLAKALQGIGAQFKGISPEADMAIDAVGSFLEVMASTGDPVKALLALTATAIGTVASAYREAAKQQEELAEKEKVFLAQISELRGAYAQQVRTENLSAAYQLELDQLNKQLTALKGIAAINASERSLAAQERSAAGAEAVRGGADKGAVASGLAEGATNDKVAKLKEQLAQGKQAIDIASDTVRNLAAKAEALNKAGFDTEVAVAATAERNKANEALDKLKEEYAITAQVTTNQIREAISAGKESQETIGQAERAALAESTKKQVADLQALVDSEGANASSQAKAALETFKRVLLDGVISPEEMSELADAQRRVSTSQEASNALVKQGFETSAKLFAGLTGTIEPAIRRIQALEQQVNALSGN